MKIKDLLKINLDNEINTVVDLDSNPDEAAIKEGLDNFVLTNSLAKHLYDFLEEFNGGAIQSGVWLSGFYGSGKSYFAQIIGLLLENKSIFGTPMRERFSVKLDGLKNEDLLRSEIGNLSRFNNIVVSFDASKHTNANGLPFMIMSAFLRQLKMPASWHGLIEYDIFLKGRHQEFLNAVQETTGESWEKAILSNEGVVRAFKPALLKMGYTIEEYNDMRALAISTRNEYDAARLQQDLSRYLSEYPDARLVFFIDEVSEAITQKNIRLDELEGVAEALAALSRKVWTIAIAQQRLDDVIKAENIQLNSLTKVRDRFRTKIAIEADEVDTIIRHRLLDKEDSARDILRDYFSDNNGMITDVTNIGVASLQRTEDVNTYIDYYPFFKHQFKLLQYFLFGSSELTQTRVGNRGMIISAFDVLKKEVKNEVADHYHVNATQLCNQADERVEEALSLRYRQAEETLLNENFKFISGKKLLQTVNFLARGGVKTTIANIAKSYLNRPEDYHDILPEVKKALDILQQARIVILTGEQFRITNEAEQRILDDMRRYDVQSWEIVQDVNNVLKKRDFVKWLSLLSLNGMNIRFKVATMDGEVYANPDENNLAVIFSDLLASPGCSDVAFVDAVRNETADSKGRLTLIPSVINRNEIKQLATELRRLKYISERTNLTDEEKAIVNSLCSDRDHKEGRFIELIENAFLKGIAIYCFNQSILTRDTFRPVTNDLRMKMFENVFTKRLGAELQDSLAPGVFTRNANQLHNYFGSSPDFKFFDTSGAFIGSGLAVVEEILRAAASFISGKEIENKLAGPPTGYSLGTVMTALAALFRGDKILVKFNGETYTSCRQPGATDAFKNARNFSKASFKAVAKGLSFQQKREIVDILKEDCNFTKNTGKSISYQLNDFELVDAIRTLALAMISKISNKIDYDEDYRRMFRKSVNARSVFQQYQGVVTEANFLNTAQNFLIDSNTDEFIKAVERVNKDIKFIDEKMREVREMKAYLEEVKDQFKKATGSDAPIKAKFDDFMKLFENDIVHHYATLKKDAQDISDIYNSSFKAFALKTQGEYKALIDKIDELKDVLSKYPRLWNEIVWDKVERLENRCEPFTDIATNFDRYSVKSQRSRLDLREVANALEAAPNIDNQIFALEADINTADPNPKPQPEPQPQPQPHGGKSDEPTPPQPEPQPQPYQPKTHKLKSRIPQGAISVADYREWLKQQLALTNSFNDKDSVNLNE